MSTIHNCGHHCYYNREPPPTAGEWKKNERRYGQGSISQGISRSLLGGCLRIPRVVIIKFMLLAIGSLTDAVVAGSDCINAFTCRHSCVSRMGNADAEVNKMSGKSVSTMN